MEKKEIADVKYVTYFIKWLITRGDERKETGESKRWFPTECVLHHIPKNEKCKNNVH